MSELWHVSADPTIEVFHPQQNELHALDEARARAVAREPVEPPAVSRESVAPLELRELGDLVARHAEAGNERVAPALHPLWDRVVETTLDFSAIRLRNAVRP